MGVVPRSKPKKGDRFAGLGAQALNEAERESVVRLALEVMANGVTDGPLMTSGADAVRYLQLKTGGERRCVMEAVLVCENDGAEYADHAVEPR